MLKFKLIHLILLILILTFNGCSYKFEKDNFQYKKYLPKTVYGGLINDKYFFVDFHPDYFFNDELPEEIKSTETEAYKTYISQKIKTRFNDIPLKKNLNKLINKILGIVLFCIIGIVILFIGGLFYGGNSSYRNEKIDSESLKPFGLFFSIIIVLIIMRLLIANYNILIIDNTNRKEIDICFKSLKNSESININLNKYTNGKLFLKKGLYTMEFRKNKNNPVLFTDTIYIPRVKWDPVFKDYKPLIYNISNTNFYSIGSERYTVTGR